MNCLVFTKYLNGVKKYTLESIDHVRQLFKKVNSDKSTDAACIRSRLTGAARHGPLAGRDRSPTARGAGPRRDADRGVHRPTDRPVTVHKGRSSHLIIIFTGLHFFHLVYTVTIFVCLLSHVRCICGCLPAPVCQTAPRSRYTY